MYLVTSQAIDIIARMNKAAGEEGALVAERIGRSKRVVHAVGDYRMRTVEIMGLTPGQSMDALRQDLVPCVGVDEKLK